MIRAHRAPASALIVIIACASFALTACIASPPAVAPASAPAAPTPTLEATPSPSPEAAPTDAAGDGGAAEPPSEPAADAEAWALLEQRAYAAYAVYLELSAGLTGDAAADAALLEQAATPEHAAAVVERHRELAEMDGRLDGQLRIESFALLPDTGDMLAHVCHDVSEVRLVRISTGEVLDDGAPLRELLVGFGLTPDGRMVVTREVEVAEQERTCP